MTEHPHDSASPTGQPTATPQVSIPQVSTPPQVTPGTSDDPDVTRVRRVALPHAPAPVVDPLANPNPVPVTIGGGYAVPPAPLDAQGRKEIQTLPPVDDLSDQIPISDATGQPRRDATMVLGMSLLYAGALVAAIGWFVGWWRAINITDWYSSTQMAEWWQPRPGSAGSVYIAIAMGAIAGITVTAPAVAAFQAWNGHRWSRVLGLISIGLSFLGILMVPVLSWVPIVLVAMGTAMLYLPNVTLYFDHWQRFRYVAPPQPSPPRQVFYGPLPRFR